MFFSTSALTRRRKYGWRREWSAATCVASVRLPKREMKSSSELKWFGSIKFSNDHSSFMLFYITSPSRCYLKRSPSEEELRVRADLAQS